MSLTDPDLKGVMLTTIDNPWNPHTNWEEWLTFDESSGYHTSGLLARLSFTSPESSEADNEIAINEGIRLVLELNPLGIHKIITKNEKPNPIPVK